MLFFICDHYFQINWISTTKKMGIIAKYKSKIGQFQVLSWTFHISGEAYNVYIKQAVGDKAEKDLAHPQWYKPLL